jgi:hypothetical protein
MTTDNSVARNGGARLRGAKKRGETGDKPPGFDPAAPPYETDAEAGGLSQPDETLSPPRSAVQHDSNAASHAAALRRWDTVTKRTSAREASLREGPAYLIWWVIIAAAVLGYALFHG